MKKYNKRSSEGNRPSVSDSYRGYTPHPRHAAVTPEIRRSRLIVYSSLTAVLVFAVVFGIGMVATSPHSEGPVPELVAQAAQSTSEVETESVGVDGESEQVDEDQDDGQQGEQSLVESVTPDPDALAWRDTEFAVNPDRRDWNYSDNGRKTIYLTIDDGPSENTQAVLDILDQYDCKATFFVVGHNDAYFPMIAEAYRRGHTIGLHSMTHDYETVYSSVDDYFADLDAIGQVVKEQIGYVPCFIRFPGGSSNMISAEYTPGIMSTLSEQVQELGYQYYDWSVSSGDGADHTAEELVGYSTEPTDQENIVFLCHDSATKQTTVEALPRIIEHYQALGYSFEALDRTSWVCHHDVGN